jgi:hypothetical protein
MITKFTQFINENSLIDTALSILDETEVPELYRTYIDTREHKIELLKYISDQAHNLHGSDHLKDKMYGFCCRDFTKKLTDAAIKAFPK